MVSDSPGPTITLVLSNIITDDPRAGVLPDHAVPAGQLHLLPSYLHTPILGHRSSSSVNKSYWTV